MVSSALETRHGVLSFDGRSQLAGILNATPDSFSDGGEYLNPERARERGRQMVLDGADLIDVGGCSTRPGAAGLTVQEELDRVIPVIEALRQDLSLPISVDTYHASVFAEAWEAGADILNDVSALRADPAMGPLLNKTKAPAILMHMQGNPQTMQLSPEYSDVVADILTQFRKTLERANGFGVSWERIVLDPGIGFGKTLEHNLSILRRIDELKSLGCPLMLGTSRKSFLGALLERDDPKDREFGTAATTAYLQAKSVEILRVHDVKAARDVLTTTQAIIGTLGPLSG